MNSALIGLSGALIGAFVAIISVILSNRLQARNEREQWIRSKKVEIYSNTIKKLLTIINLRSKVTSSGVTVLAKDDVKLWFENYIDARHQLSLLSIYSPQFYKDFKIGDEVSELDCIFNELLDGSSRLILRDDIFSSGTRGELGETTSANGIGLSVAKKNTNSENHKSIPKIAKKLLVKVESAAIDDIKMHVATNKGPTSHSTGLAETRR